MQITGEWRSLKAPLWYERLPDTVHRYRYDGNREMFISYWESLFYREAVDLSPDDGSDASVSDDAAADP